MIFSGKGIGRRYLGRRGRVGKLFTELGDKGRHDGCDFWFVYQKCNKLWLGVANIIVRDVNGGVPGCDFSFLDISAHERIRSLDGSHAFDKIPHAYVCCCSFPINPRMLNSQCVVCLCFDLFATG